MKKLRWAMDGGFWEVDLSTPVTVDGVARPAAEDPIPLGLSRGTRLSRPKQIDFFQRFMAMPFVPSFSDSNGLSFHRLISLPLPPFARDTWFSTLLGRFDVLKFTSSLPTRQTQRQQQEDSDASFFQTVWTHLLNPSFYALNFCSEWLLTPEDALLLSLEKHGGDHNNIPRKKAVLHHKFPNHNLTIEAASPTLFVDRLGNYWDVPLTLGMDFASLPSSDSGMSCHFCINHTSGSPKIYDTSPVPVPVHVPPSLLPGLCAKCAVSLKKNLNIWRSEAPKTKLAQPYDIFLSNPHISASAIIGTVITASLGDNSVRAQAEDGWFGFGAKGANSAISADLFASASVSAQHGNFQKLFLDLTRFNARIDVPSVSKFVGGASRLAVDLYNSRQAPSVEALQAIFPSASLSFQQQICGPFSFRIDCGVSVDLTKKGKEKKWWYNNVINDPVFAAEYALQVLGSAKAVAWYSPKQREFMIEVRFFET
ncbi:hypothetical protein ABFS82_03G000700 [Erythranthe guttata]|uniref:protein TRIGALACTOSYLDIACYLGLYCEROL 4, chloroplastic-like n=1 Tax=Erythranthe guttata TaxID=4155 RepID=UPI00064DC25B|nr:PREDICTED: protein TRIGALACTOSYLDIACYLGLYCEROL 4, chloroplastic-like [Erythranthe guttata]|eukprot:XP_012832840.1 PREDICTED: protein TRIGALACTOSYLDIACYLGLYCEROL 4, chloroplastic-like [Erythranthe guttata]